MKSIIKIFLILIFVASFLFVLVADTEARQGCCSWHGGVCTYTCPDGFSVGYMCCDGTSLSATCAPYYPSCPPVSQKPKIEIKLEPKIEPKTDYTILATAFAEVIRIVDGDTIEVKFSDNTIEKARLIGIDTPETVDPRKSVECFGKEASAKMKELV
ncbi:MAG: thermonuclease family protein, partial [Candidatus Portnoybacteria bacterium]|nr:thermonuclease family protein [Candidatus Portnoybacteria bacterium]